MDVNDDIQTVIVPFWAEGSFTNPRSLYYRTTADPGTLDEVVQMIAESNSNLTDFRPLIAVIATWVIHNDPTTPNLATSYQCILATDGNVSFAILLYEDPEHITSGAGYGNNHRVDFIRGERSFSLLNYASLFLPDGTLVQSAVLPRNVYRIDGQCITPTSPGQVCALNSVTTECAMVAPAYLQYTSTRCACKEGYFAVNQLTCNDVDECGRNTSICGVNSMCINLPGTFQCVCNPGFTGNGINCEDIDECSLLHDCDQRCVNTFGGFNCTCEEGYLDLNDSRNCTDINECLEEDSPCSADAQCTNSDGSFLCECNVGFEGDGLSCSSGSNLATILGGSLGGFFAFLVVAILLICAYAVNRRNKRKRDTLSAAGEGGENQYFQNYMVRSTILRQLPKSLIVPSSNLVLGKTIGQGEFGIVYKGQLKSAFSDKSSQPVAVKTLKGFVHQELVEDLLKECAGMLKFDHPNVLKLTGVCLDGGPAPYIIVPFMANGSLVSYLKENRDKLLLDPATTSHDDAIETEKRLLDMCIQVAKGMEYLASKRVIHRDLAARNCMIDTNFVIKVADFGLAESIDTTKEYFRQGQDNIVKLPIKWLAPESIHDGVFSEKSDVWSFGVTCWEIFAGGKAPYPGVHPHDVAHKLQTGYRMDKPPNAACSNDMYTLMLKCWVTQVDVRPNFAQLVKLLSSQLDAKAGYLEFTLIN